MSGKASDIRVGGTKEARIGQDIGCATGLLRNRRVVGIPTRPARGLAANALGWSAVLMVFEAGNGPVIHPLIVHAWDPARVDDVAVIPPDAEELRTGWRRTG